MFTDSDSGQSFLVQLEYFQSYYNLLFRPEGDAEEMERKARKLFHIYGDPNGVFTYFDFDERAMRGIRASNVDEIMLRANAENAPCEGVLFVENLLNGLNLKGV